MGKLALRRNKRFKQGIFYPKNREKYVGSIPAVYRSGLELSYFRMLDQNPNVVKWGSEEIIVPYYFNGGLHRYYVDLFVIFKSGDKLVKYFIELKPESQLSEPKWSPRRKKETYLYECFMWQQNQAKWKAANEYAKQHGFEFKILTEKDMKARR